MNSESIRSLLSNRIFVFLCGVFFVFSFVIFSYLVHKDIFTQLDFDTTVRLQDNIPSRLDVLFSTFSDIGKFEVCIIVLVAFFIIARKIVAGLVGLALFAGFHVIELFGKFFVNHAPPPQFMLKTQTIIDFPQFHVRAENSYPSGHSGRTMFISILFVVFILNSRLPVFVKLTLIGGIVAFDVTMLVSRAYLGEHWTTDIVGGSLLGLGLGIICSVFLLRKKGEVKSHNSVSKHDKS